MKLMYVSKKVVLCSSISAILGVGSAYASVLEELVVTAQKREQNLQDVGISVSAMSGNQMKALGLDNTQEITQQIPGLQMQTFSPALLIFNLRGISQNNFQDNLEAPVAAYFDDVYIGSMNAIGGQMFDMERTEVLRGPQGTLFGRNATGGLIHFLTKGADDDQLNGYVQGEISEFDSYNLEAAIGGSLSDTVRYRLAGRIDQSDGYFESAPVTPAGLAATEGLFGLPPGTLPPAGGDAEDVIGADSYALRAKLQIDVNDNTTVDLTAAYSEDDDAPVGQWAVHIAEVDPTTLLGGEIGESVTGDVHKHGGSNFSIGGVDTGLDRDMKSLTARITSELSNGLEFISITNWFDMDKSHREDGGGGVDAFPFLTESAYEQWSQEFRISGDGEGYRWQAGAYYLDIEVATRSAVGGPVITGSPLGIIDNFGMLESTNWSVFGQVEYDLNDTLTLIAGYRWSQDDKELEFRNVATSGLVGVPDGTVLFNLSEAAVGQFADVPEIDYGDFAARLQLNWQMNDETLVFLSYNRGIKGGNWSLGSRVDLDNFKHKEETLHAYELGIKTTLADGLARLNATVFNYDYEDYQAFSLTGLIPQVANSDATNVGGEIELTLLPTEQWDIMLGLSFVDSEIEASPGPLTVIEDTELPSAPGYSFNYLFRYNWDALGGNLALQLDGVYNDDQFLESHNGGSSLQDSYSTANISINYTSGDGGWDLRLWVKNLNDEEYAMYSLDIGGFVIRQYAPPRWYGITASYNF